MSFLLLDEYEDAEASPDRSQPTGAKRGFNMERTYEFSFRFAAPVRTPQPDDWIDRLAEAGCDDALIGTGVPGSLALKFDRTASDVAGVLDDQAAMTIVHELGDSSVVLRCYGWVDQRQNSFFKVHSEAIRHVKEAFDQAGIVMPEPVYRLRITDRVEARGISAGSALERSGSSGGYSGSSAERDGEVADVGVDRAIEERVIADARSGERENPLSQKAEKEI